MGAIILGAVVLVNLGTLGPLALSFAVNAVLSRQLRSIDMVAALKAGE